MSNQFGVEQDKGYTGHATGALAGALLGVALLGIGLYFIFGFGRGQAQNTKNNEDINFFSETQTMNSQSIPLENAAVTELQIKILQEGSGVEAKAGDVVSVHYTGWLTNSTKFDSSIDRGTPFQFKLGAQEVIQGWDQGVVGMKVGEKRQLVIPSSLGYGASGTPGGPIPPNATLIFEVEMININ